MAPSILPKPGWAIAHPAQQPLTPLHWTERRKDRKIADVADIIKYLFIEILMPWKLSPI